MSSTHVRRAAALTTGLATAAASVVLLAPGPASSAPAVSPATVAAAAATAPVAMRAVSGPDRTWMAAAHQSNLAEIAAGKAAVHRATTAGVREHGRMFIRDHRRLDRSLRHLAGVLGVTLPAAPTAAQQQALALAETFHGRAFDAAWVATQLVGHRGALRGTRIELRAGSDNRVLAAARTAKPVVQTHLRHLRSLIG